LRSQLGLELRYSTRVGSIWLTPHASAAWQHEYLDGNHDITSEFGGVGGSFTVETAATEHDSAFIDVGLDASVCDDLTLFVDYETEAGEERYEAQSVEAGVKIGF
jgi:outer membrane autotransporter protein